jgi:Domain of unknown function (DUF4157)/Predicted lipoprotein of unknown function (DUF2380)
MSAHAHAIAKDSSTMPLPTSVAAKSQPLTNSSSAGLFLQRKCACGSSTASLTGECGECKSKKLVQTKLTIGASNDPLEHEADRVADQVLAAPANPAVSIAPPKIQRFTGQPSSSADMPAPATVDRVLSSPGALLEPALRHDMEQRFGHDFSRVRVHSDAAAGRSARDINANAYTVRQNIVFGAGQFAPHESGGRKLLAHELAHVVQQGVPGDPAADPGKCEHDAENAAGSIGSGNAPVVRTSAVFGTVQRQPINAAQKKSRMVRIERYWGSPSARAYFEDGSNEEVTFVQASRLDPASQPEGAFEKVVNLTIDRSSTIRPHVEFASHSSGSNVKVVTRLAPADRISKLPGKVRGELSESFLSDTANESIPETMEFVADIGEGLKETSSTTKIELEGRDPATVATMQVVDQWVGEQQSTLDKLGTMRRARFTQLLSDVRQVKVTGPTKAEDLNAQDIELVLAGAAGGQSDFKTFDEFKRIMQWKLRSKEISIPEENADNPNFYIKNEYRKEWKAEAAGLRKMSRIAETAEVAPFIALGLSAAVGSGGALLEVAGAGVSDWLLARGVTSGSAGLELGGEKVAEWFAARGISSGLLAKWVGTSLLASGVASQFLSAREEAKGAGIDPNSALGFANTISTAVLRGFGIGQLGESITDTSIQTGQPLNRSALERIVGGIEGGVNMWGALHMLGAFGTPVPEGSSVPSAPAPAPIGKPTLPGALLAIRLRLAEIMGGAENARANLGLNTPASSIVEGVAAESTIGKAGSTVREGAVPRDPAITPDLPTARTSTAIEPDAPVVKGTPKATTQPPAKGQTPPPAPTKETVEEYFARTGKTSEDVRVKAGPEPKKQITAQPGAKKDDLSVYGEGQEVSAVQGADKRRAGMAAKPKHHVYPQEIRPWFEKRGFKGKNDIDNFTVELEEAAHQAIHGGGNYRVGRTWSNEWNQRVMRELFIAEVSKGKALTMTEIKNLVKNLMEEYGIKGPFKPYR